MKKILLVSAIALLAAGCLKAPNKPAATSQDMSSWKTYSNTKEGYSFKYPADYIVYTSLVAKQQIVYPAASNYTGTVYVAKNDQSLFALNPPTLKIVPAAGKVTTTETGTDPVLNQILSTIKTK